MSGVFPHLMWLRREETLHCKRVDHRVSYNPTKRPESSTEKTSLNCIDIFSSQGYVEVCVDMNF